MQIKCFVIGVDETFFFFGTGGQNRALELAKQVPEPLSQIPGPDETFL